MNLEIKNNNEAVKSTVTNNIYEIKRPADVKKYVAVANGQRLTDEAGKLRTWDIRKAALRALQVVENAADPSYVAPETAAQPKKGKKAEKLEALQSELATAQAACKGLRGNALKEAKATVLAIESKIAAL